MVEDETAGRHGVDQLTEPFEGLYRSRPIQNYRHHDCDSITISEQLMNHFMKYMLAVRGGLLPNKLTWLVEMESWANSKI